MGESSAESVVDPQTADAVITWLRENYEAIVEACRDKQLPKPPPV